MAKQAEEELLRGVADLYRDKKYADVELIGSNKTWLAHKLVLCAHSEVFRKDCDGEFKEAKLAKIDLSDEDPQAVEAMLSFLYTHDYSDYVNGQDDVVALALDARVFIIADKRFIPALKQAATTKFAARAEKEWSTPAFAAAISELYQDGAVPDRALLDVILKLVKKHAKKLFVDSARHLEFHAALKDLPDFCYDVCQTLGSKKYGNEDKKALVRYRCPRCSTVFSLELPSELSGSSFDCPRRCYNPQQQSWWESYKVEEEL